MHKRYSDRRRAAVFAGILTLAAAVSAGMGGALAQSAADDDEDAPLDTKVFRQVMKGLGFRNNNEVGIEYRERAPLVVPPSRNLPPPQNEGTSTNIPAWPKDPDVARRKEATAAERAKLRRAGDRPSEDGRPLRPDELKATGQASASAANSSGAPGLSGDEAARPLSPSQLGGNGSKNWFNDIFSSIGPARPESAPFTGEPPRTSMTAPPPGYQTPSPSQPYGMDLPRETPKASTVEQRMEAQR
jgi:hypothetical protein